MGGKLGSLKGSIPVDKIMAVESLPEAESALVFMFEIVHSGAILYCQAWSKGDRDSWVTVIRAASPHIVSQMTPKQSSSTAAKPPLLAEMPEPQPSELVQTAEIGDDVSSVYLASH